jgi:hypothetical protein
VGDVLTLSWVSASFESDQSSLGWRFEWVLVLVHGWSLVGVYPEGTPDDS